MKKALVLLAVVLGTSGVFAWHHPGWHHRHCYGGGWAAVGTGFAAGIVGAALYNAVAPRETVVVQQPAPVVVQQPVIVQQPAAVVVQQPAAVVVQPSAATVAQQPTTVVVPRQQVWVSGRYVQQIQPNGTAITVWQPGHYE